MRPVRPLAVVGNITRDVVDGGPPRVGGGPLYAARMLRLSGAPGRIATMCADADRDLLRPLARLGLPVTWRAARSTASFCIAYEGEHRTLEVEALGEPWRPQDLRGWAAPVLRGAAWVHLAGLSRADFPAETVAAAARAARVSLDGQGLVRAARTGPVRLDADFDPAVLRRVSVLKLAEGEARVLGALDADGLQALGVREIVVTRGSEGSLVWSRGRLERIPAVPVRGPVDPTGAGDAFAAAYLSARAGGYDAAPAARRASQLVSTLLGRWP